MRSPAVMIVAALALAPAAVRGQVPTAPPLVPAAVVVADAGTADAPASRGGLGRFVLGEVIAGSVSSIGFAENGGRIKAGVFAAGGLLVLRDFFEARPLTPTRGHAVTIAGLAALAVADLAMEREGASRGTIVLVDFLALHAIALAARDRSPR